jgi:hypothetical protein
MAKEGIGQSFLIATFCQGWVNSSRRGQEAQGARWRIIESTPSLPTCQNHFDLAVFRGALFFPALFEVDFVAIDSILRPGGTAVVGGGFGKFTPKSVIEKIAKRSRNLNVSLGK